MAASKDKLKEQGWHLTDDGFQKLSEDGKITDSNKIINLALDTDFKEIGGGAFPTDIKGGKVDVGPAGIVVQVLKMRNISAPKANEESKARPRLLKIIMTDGQQQYSGLEYESIPALSLNTTPGTKIHLKNGPIQVSQNLMLLKPTNVSVLGGNVTALVEKWELNRRLGKFGKAARGSGPGAPPWVPFGKPIQSAGVDLNLKTSQIEKEKQMTKEEAEFQAHRNEAIEEAKKLGIKKVFGGGGSQKLLDYNVQKIVDKGYTEDEAKYALKLTRNDLSRALANLKRRSEKAKTPNEPYNRSRNPREEREDTRRGGRRGKMDLEESTKPSGKISLFDFLEDKLPQTASTSKAAEKSNSSTAGGSSKEQVLKKSSSLENINRSRFENNISSSFASRQKQLDEPSTSTSHNQNDRGKFNTLNRSEPSSSRDQHFREDRRYQNKQSSYVDNKRGNTNYSSKGSGNPANATSFQKSDAGYSFDKTKAPRFQRQEYDNQKTNSNHSQPKKTNDNINSSENQVNNLINATANLHINSASSNKDSFSKTFPQIPNGLSYNPNKIMGFQNKETNEFALNLLRSQQYPPPSVTTSSVTPTTNIKSGPTPSLHQQQQPQQFPSHILSQPPPNMHPQKMIQQPHRTLHHQQQLQQQLPHPPFVMHPQQHAYMHHPPPQSHQPQQPHLPSASNQWQWKLGDKCLAKYWEDSRYYNAEITGVSIKTCVVHFLEYGNYEEVLKDDCLPITTDVEDTITMSRTTAATSHHPPAGTVATASKSFNSRQVNASARFNKSERPMYVPPAQRSHHK